MQLARHLHQLTFGGKQGHVARTMAADFVHVSLQFLNSVTKPAPSQKVLSSSLLKLFYSHRHDADIGVETERIAVKAAS